MRKLRIAVVASVLLVSVVAGASAQSLGEIARKAAAAKAAKEQNGNTQPPKVVVTNKDLPPEPPAKPTEPVGADAKTQDALAALRAVQSVLEGGANATEFKRYYLEAKVKVDALPPAAANAPLGAISDLYADAVTLSIATQVREMSGSEVKAFKARYSTDYEFLSFFKDIPDEGVGVRTLMTSTELERSVITLHAAEQILLIRAEEKLRAIKS
jgi:hypothetical protein